MICPWKESTHNTSHWPVITL